jgi:uncharacterized coiled-coil protein SlyX
MDTDETPNAKPISPWTIALVCSALVLLVAAGGAFSLRDKLLSKVSEDIKAEQSTREKLAARIDTLQSTLDALSNQPKTDSETLGALNTQLAETSSKLDILTSRVDGLEKQLDGFKPTVVPAPPAFAPTPPPMPPAATPAPTPALPEAAPVSAVPPIAGHAELTTLKLAALSGKPFASELVAWTKLNPEHEKKVSVLTEFAANGIISEVDLTRKLREALDTQSQTITVDDTSVAGKINTHLKGLVRIKKANSADPLTELRKAVLRDDAETLTRGVERLNDADRAPLEAWLKQARARRAALDEVSKLSTETSH